MVSHIAHGLALLLGISRMDDASTVDRMADKVSTLRIFEDSAGKMNLSVSETKGSILVVSQFTLFGDATRGRRPSYTGAADPESARLLYERFAERLRGLGHHVA